MTNLYDKYDTAISKAKTSGALPTVDDPEQTFADMTRDDYLRYVKDYSKFEDDLIAKASTDTSLVDQARDDAKIAQGLTQGVASRNAQRYGVGLTPAQQLAQQRNIQLGTTLSGIQGVSDAQIAQRELNKSTLADLINIGQGVNRASQSQMSSAAGNQIDRRMAYDRAKAQSKMNTYSTLGSLGSLALIATGFQQGTIMALADALLSTFRTQQIANQQRQANQLQRERLDVSRQQLGLQKQQEGRLAEQFEIEQRGRSNDGVLNSLYNGDYYNIETNAFDRDRFRQDIEDVNAPNHALAKSVAVSMMQNTLGGISTPEGFTIDSLDKVPNGWAFGGDYNWENGSAGRGVLTEDGTSFPDSKVATFSSAEDIAKGAELYFKTTLLQDGKLAENYPGLAAARKLVENENPYLQIAANAATEAINTGTSEGNELGRNALATLAGTQENPDITQNIASDLTGMPGSDAEIDAPSVSEAPASVQSGSSVIDTLKQRQGDINDRKLDNLLGAYERNLNAYQTDAPDSEVAAIKQRRLDKAKADLEAYPAQQLADLETERDVLQSRSEKGGRPASAARGQLRAINAEIQQHKADYNLEDAAPISAAVTNPEQKAAVEDAAAQADALRLTSKTVQTDLETLGRTFMQNPSLSQATAIGMQAANINNLNDAQRADLKSRKMIYAFIANMASTDAQKDAAYNSLINLETTGIDDINTRDAAAMRNDDIRNALDQQTNSIRTAELFADESERVQELKEDALAFYDEVAGDMEEIAPSGEANYSDDERKAQIDAYTQRLLPRVRERWDNAAPAQKPIYKNAILRIVSEVGQMAAGTSDGGFWESAISWTRDSAQNDPGDLAASSLRITEVDKNGRVVSFIKVDGDGNTQGEEVAMSKLAGFSRDAAAMLEILLLDGANTDSGT